MKKLFLGTIIIISFLSCSKKSDSDVVQVQEQKTAEVPFLWENANLYFLLTDRFNNGNPENDINFDRTKETAVLRGFMGGDLQGITKKIKEGYFTDLGINAIWFTPIVEQIHGGTDEGTGFTYGFHGYWTKDWTTLDPNFGNKNDLKELVQEAHSKGIRIVMDAVINHTGPVTTQDPVWPESWVRTEPKCEFDSYETAVTCTLVKNLPDVLTESDQTVDLPKSLTDKWKKEGRYEQEMKELDEFFARTGYPRAPRYYIIKWLTDYIREFGIDGYRADTVRHIEESVWAEFKKECDLAFEEYKKQNPDKVLDDNDFYMVGEVYDYEILSSGKDFDFGDVKVNYYDHGFNSMINFEFKKNALEDYESLFSSYSRTFNHPENGYQVLNYVSSHDDSSPFDKAREKPFESATKLLLSPGTAQWYYGDESARTLIVAGTEGDATLRSLMNWEEIRTDERTQKILAHWKKLGTFRNQHPSIGAGQHQMLSSEPYLFKRELKRGSYSDLVIVGLDLPIGEKNLEIGSSFAEGSSVHDAYSGKIAKVINGKLNLDTSFNIVLLEKINP